ncbi:hypothetical protein OnM2_017087, partial [Erysiphe neolycopersici]
RSATTYSTRRQVETRKFHPVSNKSSPKTSNDRLPATSEYSRFRSDAKLSTMF